MTATHPEAALSAREAEKTAAVKAAILPELSITEAVMASPQRLEDLKAARIARVAVAALDRLSTAHPATAGDGGEKRADAAMRAIWAEWLVFYNRHFRGVEGISLADQMAFYEIAQPLLRALAQAPAGQAPAGEDGALAKAITQACFDPGRLAGPRGDRTVDGWRADAVLAVLGTPASPTLTDAQPKAARPVGDEALREALKKVVSSALYKNQFKRDWREHIDPVANAVLSFLAAHPTTRQETVATPRDGGVREARHQWCQPGDDPTRRWVLKFEDADRGECVFDDETQAREAFREADGGGWNCYLFAAAPRAALAAPGSAGPGEHDETEDELDERIARQGARENMRLIDSISDLIGLPHDVELELHHVRDALALATPSPAQEPGTGDTGEAPVSVRTVECMQGGYSEVRLVFNRVADATAFAAKHTPATTAETRGPAEGGR